MTPANIMAPNAQAALPAHTINSQLIFVSARD